MNPRTSGIFCWALILSSGLSVAQNSATAPERPGVSVLLPGRYTTSSIITVQFTEAPGIEISSVAWVVESQPDDLARANTTKLASINRNLRWGPFQSTARIDLGAGDGARALWFAFRTSNGEVFWKRSRIVVDTAGPKLEVIQPIQGIVTEPVIQVRGIVTDELRSLTYEIKNSSGTLKNQSASIVNRTLDRRKLAMQTEFQLVDVQLAAGRNTLTLFATDIVGNTSTDTIHYELDISQDQAAPELAIQWPRDGEEINASMIRVRGRVSEPNATVSVIGLGEKPLRAIVERDGQFWAYGGRLGAKSNTFTVVATDPAGNQSQKTLTVIKSDVEVMFDEVPEEEKVKRIVTVTGRVSHPGHTVWVNGIKAEMRGNQWKATNIPLNRETGTAILQAVAIPNAINGGNGYRAGKRTVPTLEDFGNPRKAP